MYTPEQVREIADKACRYDNSRYQPWSDSNSPHYGDAEDFVRRVLDCISESASPAVAYRLETDGHITYWPESWQVELERKSLQSLGYPAKVTPLYEHSSPPQAWKVAFDAQREAAMRAHTICYEVMLAHPEIAELGDDGRLHDAIHDILRVDLHAATLKAAQGGVTEAMVERALIRYAMLKDQAVWPDAYSDDEREMERRDMRAALEAALSAQQGQGEAVAVIGADFTIHWAGTGPIAPIIEKHCLKVGDKLYATAVAEQQSMNEPSGNSGEFNKGVLEGLSVATDVCGRLVMALDGGGNEYRRPANAEQCANAIRSEYARRFRTTSPAPSPARGDGGEG